MSIPIKVYSDVEFGAGSLTLHRTVNITGSKSIKTNGSIYTSAKLYTDEIKSHTDSGSVTINSPLVVSDITTSNSDIPLTIGDVGNQRTVDVHGSITSSGNISTKSAVLTGHLNPKSNTLYIGGSELTLLDSKENYTLTSTSGNIELTNGANFKAYWDTCTDQTTHSSNTYELQINYDSGLSAGNYAIVVKYGYTSSLGTFSMSKTWLLNPDISNSTSFHSKQILGPTEVKDSQMTISLSLYKFSKTETCGLLSAQGYIRLGAVQIDTDSVSAPYIYGNEIRTEHLYSVSDQKLKTNIIPYQSNRSILTLPIYEYDYIQTGTHAIGCLAQDLQQICPQIVQEGSDGYLTIQESKIVYLLLEEMKKMRLELDELKQNK